MFVVPEVDDDMEVSTPTEVAKPITQPEATKQLTPPPPTTPTLLESVPIQMSVPPPAPPLPTKQHRSRRSLFHRNTIHVCDQIVDRITSHQQHHSAPPSQNPQSKTGLQSIHEHLEYLPPDGPNESKAQPTVNARFPRSSTVPYPAYATVRAGDPYRPHTQYYYSDHPAFLHGTLSPAQANTYINTRQPFAAINTNFQPISPHHQQYSSRPVDILKPTFLIVPKEAEQQLSSQLSASNSPVPPATKPSVKAMPKKQEKKSASLERTSPTVRSVEVQTGNASPPRPTSAVESAHVGVLATPNPSPYVHFVHVPYSTQSPAMFQDGPPETSIIHEEFIHVNEYHPGNASIRSMPNIALAQVSPHHLYGSPNMLSYPHHQQLIYDEQQQAVPLTNTESSGVRSATLPQMAPISKVSQARGRLEAGETDESSVASLDFAHTDLVDVPGSWRYRSLPDGRSIPVARRYRAPLPQAFLENQQYASDSEQVIRSSSFRHPQQQHFLAQSRPFGSIPTINRPFDSIRSHATNNPSASGLRLNEKDVLKIGAFYQSIGTLVYVARSVATLYTSDFDAMANLRDWKKLYTGVPIWLFNTGMNPKRNRCIRLLMSELGSSFTLWDTVVNGASDVRLPKVRHITLKSLETGTVLALKFDDAQATDEFHQYFVKLSSDLRNADLFDIFNAKRRRPVFILRKRKVKKSSISKPTEFNHITKVDEHDRDSLYTYSVLVDDGAVVA